MFDWSVREVGVLMSVLGLAVLPVNAMVGRMSMVYEDRCVTVSQGVSPLLIPCVAVSPPPPMAMWL